MHHRRHRPVEDLTIPDRTTEDAPASGFRPLRILLVQPRMSLRPMDTEFKRRMSPSLSLAVLAGLTPPGHDVRVADENLGPVEVPAPPPDLVGITVNVDTARRAFEISDRFRQAGSKVVFGGIHASADPDSVLPHCDAVCVGEAETVWESLLADLQAGRMRRIYRADGPCDLVDVPFPAWNLFPRSSYLYDNIVVASRGCPFRCEFCYNSCDYVHNRHRTRPVENVIEEIRRLETRQVMFIDDNLIGDMGWIRRLLDAMEPLGLTWHGAVSTNLVHHPDLVARMAATGCRSLFVGFESIHADSIRSAGKTQNRIEEYDRLIALLHGHGIMVNASLVFGFDHDTPDTFDRTLRWLIDNRVETMTSHILTPYPGTRLHRRLEEEGRILERDLDRYNTSNATFQPRHMSPRQLRDGYLRMYAEFYGWRSILRRRPRDRRRLVPYLLFNLGYRRYGRVVSALGRWGWMRSIGRLARRLSYGID